MKYLKDIFTNKEKRDTFYIVVSTFALVVSFFNIGDLKIDASWVAIILCGAPIIKGAFIGLCKGFDIKAGVLVSIALIAAIYIGETFAAGEVALIMAIGELLEERTLKKARSGIEKLIQLTPRTARVIKNGEENIILSENVKVGDYILVLPGESVPVDGIITKGETSINQSIMTGESLPADKKIGDNVFSGTVNQFGAFEMKAEKVGEDSSLSRMIQLVKSADAKKAKIVGFAERFATWIVVIALVSAIGTWIITGEIIRGVTILVVFCPCALVLATPTAIVAGIGNASRHGILVREGDALERLSKVNLIAFDKTGTLTHGKPEVVEAKCFDKNISEEKMLSLIASCEIHSEHPLGKAIIKYYRSKTNKSPNKPSEFKVFPGKGVTCKVGEEVVVAGNKKLLEDLCFISDEIIGESEKSVEKGCIVIFIGINKRLVGFIALSDTLRLDSKETIEKIHETNVDTVLLTGDSFKAANYIAKMAKVTKVYAECLPEEKMDMIAHSQEKNQLVCMVGDGINDAPALKKANVGIAMGGIGSDIAIDAADIVLISDDIVNIPHLISLSRKMMITIKWNLVLSMILNFVAIILAMTGILTPVLGALVHNLGSVLVVVNSSLLLNWRK